MYKNQTGRSDASKKMEKQPQKVKDLYFVQKKSLGQLAKIFDTNIGVIQYFFKIYNIEKRPIYYRPFPSFKKQETEKAWKSIDNIKKLYTENSLTCDEIGDIYNVSRGTIIKFLKTIGIDRRRKIGRKYRDVDIWKKSDKIIDMYVNQNMSCVEISKRFCCANNTIKRLLIEKGIAVRNSSKSIKTADAWNNVENIIRLHKNTVQSMNQIAKQFNVSSSTIKKILIANDAYVTKRQR